VVFSAIFLLEEGNMKSDRGLSKFIKSKSFILLVLVVVCWVAFAILSEGKFIKLVNIRNILNSMVVTILLTIGAVCLMISGAIDLSTTQISVLSGILLASFLTRVGLPWPIAILATLAVASLIGFFNALLINKFKFQPFIATMAMSSVVQGLTFLAVGVKNIDIKNEAMTFLGTYRIGDLVPITLVIALVFMAVYGVMLAKTYFGKTIYMIGGNPRAARLAGMNPSRMSYILFMNNAALGGVAGMLLAIRMRTGTVLATTNQFAGMTGAILGGVSFGGGSGGMGGAFIGMLLLNGFNNGLTVIGIHPYWQTFAGGALLIIALAFDYFGMKRSGRLPQ
jgi:ribose/xylose/arabinose/galactoside ABC-type transport system permease subunit